MNTSGILAYLGEHFGAALSAIVAAATGLFAIYLNWRSQKSKEQKDAIERDKGISEEERERIKSIFDGGDQFQERLIKHLESLQIQLNEALTRESTMRQDYLAMQARDVSRQAIMDDLLAKEKLALSELDRIQKEYDAYRIKFTADMQAQVEAYKALQARYADLEAIVQKYQASTPQTVVVETTIKKTIDGPTV